MTTPTTKSILLAGVIALATILVRVAPASAALATHPLDHAAVLASAISGSGATRIASSSNDDDSGDGGDTDDSDDGSD